MADRKFTKEQKSVIEFKEGSLLVSAAAGSGKTAVLVERILGLLMREEDPVSLDELLVMTFTRAAAAEMKSRIADAIDGKLSEGGLSEESRAHLETQRTILPRAMVNTIDSVCQRLIRQYFQQLDIDPGFRVADENELKLLRSDIMKKLLEEKYEEADPAFCDLARRFSGAGTEDRVSSLVERFWQRAVSAAWPMEFLKKCQSDALLEKAGEMEKTAWFTDLLKKEAADARDMAELSLRGKAASEAPGGWTPYTPIFADLAAFYESVAAAAKTGGKEGWDALHAIASEQHKWELSRVRNVPGSTAEEKEREKKVIDTLRDLADFSARYRVSYGELSSRTALAAEDVLVLCGLTITFTERFGEMKREKNLVDFADMEHLCLDLLYEGEGEDRKPSATADELAGRLKEIMIDEYQDTGEVQEELIRALSAERLGRPDVFMVGDVKQSIYSFREARPELFMEKHKGEHNSVIELNRNFRSRPEVLYFVNDVFSTIMSERAGGTDYDETASLKAGRRDCVDTGGAPVFAADGSREAEFLVLDTESEKTEEFSDVELESFMIAERIRELVGPETGVTYKDIAILIRKNKLAEPLLAALSAKGIPAYFDSGSGYFESPEVRTMLAVLSVIDNPVQDIPLAAVMRSPHFGSFTDDELAMMAASFRKRVLAGGTAECDPTNVKAGAAAAATTFRQTNGAFYAALKAMAEKETPLGTKCAAFLSHLNDLRDASERLSCHELIWRIYRESGIYEAASSLPDGVRRRKNLDLLLEKAEVYAGTGYHGLFNFNRYIEQLKKYDEDMGEASAAVEGQNIVTVTTMHRAKGLQYPVTIVAFLDRRFSGNEKRETLKIHRKYGASLDCVDLEERVRKLSVKSDMITAEESASSVSEEMRLLYVAMTRAEEKLILTAAAPASKLPFAETAAACQGQPVDWPKVRKIPPAEVKKWNSMLPMITESGALSRGNIRICVKERLTVDTEIITKSADVKENNKDTVNHSNTDEINTEKYPFPEETQLKPKVSVSEIKERRIETIDEEFVRDLAEKKAVKGAEFGTKVHRAFEVFDYALPGEAAIDSAADRVFSMDAVSAAEEMRRDREATKKILTRFVATPLYETMRDAFLRGKLRREQHFMAGFPACDLTEGAESKELQIVQGIIDACIIEDDGITLIDYKTDSVSEADGERELKARYTVQLLLYAKALAQLCRRSVADVRMVIYSTKLGRAIEL